MFSKKSTWVALACTLFCFAANSWAQDMAGYHLEDYVIQSGPNAGKKLIDVVRSYRAGGIQIPERAIDDVFSAFDQYHSSTHDYLASYPCPSEDGYNEICQRPMSGVPVIGNQRYVFIMDEDKSSSKPRFHKIDLLTGKIESTIAGNGYGSDCNDGKGPCDFNNHDAMRTGKSSPRGFFVSSAEAAPARPHKGEAWRKIIPLSGIERPTPGGFEGNDFVQSIAIHNAGYVSKTSAGHSYGCVAMNSDVFPKWEDQMTGGALIYYYTKQLDKYDRTGDVVNSGTSTWGPGDAPGGEDGDPRIQSDRRVKVLQPYPYPGYPAYPSDPEDGSPSDAGGAR